MSAEDIFVLAFAVGGGTLSALWLAFEIGRYIGRREARNERHPEEKK